MKKAMKCSGCGGTAKFVGDIEFLVELEDRDVLIANLTGYRCARCGMEYHSADTVERVQSILKAIKKRPTIKFARKLTRSGKRWVVGIPPEIMEALGLHGGEKTKLHVKGQNIVAEFPSE